MEATLDSYRNDHFAAALGSEQNDFSYDSFVDYPDTDEVQQSYTPGFETGFHFGQHIQDSFAEKYGQPSDIPRSSHDDLNQFFNDAAFANITSSPDQSMTAQRSALYSSASKGQAATTFVQDYGGLTEPWTSHDGLPLAVVTASLNAATVGNTTVQHGQITPGDSPASPAKSTRYVDEPKAETQSSRRKSENSQTTNETTTAKRTRKPRKSSKKPPSREQEVEKRETFLKRNREAAHKCRIKKKYQNDTIMEKVKVLTEEHALKGFQVESLKQEVESLRALLMPHYQRCADENLRRYIDETSTRLPDWSTMGVSMIEQPASNRSSFDTASERCGSVATSLLKMENLDDEISLSRDCSRHSSVGLVR